MAILGVSLGTTTVGIALVGDNRLLHAQTHSFRDPWSDQKADAIVAKLAKHIWRYHVRFVVIKLPPKSHQPSTIIALIRKLTILCEYHGCMVSTCTKEELKRHIPHARNHHDLMRFAIEQYPVVIPEFTRATKQKNRYHHKLFEAIVAAHLANKKGG